MNTFETARLKLSTFEENDLKEYYKIITDKAVRDFLPLATARSKHDALMLITTYSNVDFKRSFAFKITLKSNSKLVGAIMGSGMSASTLDVSFLASKAYRNKGYITEALRKFIEYVSANSDYKIISFRIDPKNTPATRIIRKVDAQKVNIMRGKEIWQIEL